MIIEISEMIVCSVYKITSKSDKLEFFDVVQSIVMKFTFIVMLFTFSNKISRRLCTVVT